MAGFGRLASFCSLIAGVALFAIMALTFFDVGGRKFLDNSIPGTIELTELLMVVVIFAALPLVSERSEHVVFDSLNGFLPPSALRIRQALIEAGCAVALFALAALMWKTGGDFLASGETTPQLRIAKAPFIYGMAVFCSLAGVAHLVLAFRPWARPAGNADLAQ